MSVGTDMPMIGKCLIFTYNRAHELSHKGEGAYVSAGYFNRRPQRWEWKDDDSSNTRSCPRRGWQTCPVCGYRPPGEPLVCAWLSTQAGRTNALHGAP